MKFNIYNNKFYAYNCFCETINPKHQEFFVNRNYFK